MGVQLESLGQSAFTQLGPWRIDDTRLQPTTPVNLGAALLEAALPVLNGQYCEWPRAKYVQYPAGGTEDSSSAVLKAPKLPSTEPSDPLLAKPSTKPTSTNTAHPEVGDAPVRHSSPVFAYSPPAGHVFVLPVREPLSARSPDLKRIRADTDVDGFNTSMLSCKKRRLLRTLITSRLSRPFSLPAAHILNREAATSGDKRFLKFAAMAAARRMGPAGVVHPPPPPPPSQSTLMRRQALINSSRVRLQREAIERGELPAAALAHSPAPPGHRGAEAADARALPTPSLFPPSPPWRPRGPFRASPPGSPVGLRATEPSIRLPPSPGLRPLRSPELRSTRPAIDLDDVDDLDDEDMAFPTSEHESRYEDEPDDVYADFGLIFGGGEGDLSDDEGDHYEDYLDDVDGIPWNARC